DDVPVALDGLVLGDESLHGELLFRGALSGWFGGMAEGRLALFSAQATSTRTRKKRNSSD
ncbi:MAG: hypothetical protein ACK40R_07510, partial [Thermomonas sp.]